MCWRAVCGVRWSTTWGQAVNGALQGMASESVTFTLPLAARAVGYRSLAAAEVGETTAVRGNGNGHGRSVLAGAAA